MTAIPSNVSRQPSLVAAVMAATRRLIARLWRRTALPAVPGPLLVVAFDDDAVATGMLVADEADDRPVRLAAPQLPRFHIAEMVDDIDLADLRLLRSAFSSDEVRDALRTATGIADLEVVLGERRDIEALLTGAMSSRQIRRAIARRRLTTSLSARALRSITT